MVTYFVFIIPHVILCLFAARKLHNSYLHSGDKNVQDFQRTFIVLGIAFALGMIASSAMIFVPLRIIVDPLLTITIILFFRIVFRILRKPKMSRVVEIVGLFIVLAEIFLRIVYSAPPLLIEVPPFYSWAIQESPRDIGAFFSIIRAIAGITVMFLFLWIGRVSEGALRTRYLLIGGGLLLLPLGLVAGGLAESLLPINQIWPNFAVGSFFALAGLLVTLKGIYYELPKKT